MIKTSRLVLLIAACCLTVASCGASSDKSSDKGNTPSSGPSKSSPTPNKPTIARAAFCDKLDLATVEGAFGKITKTTTGKPGDTSTFGGRKTVAKSFSCIYDVKDDGFVGISVVGEPATAEALQTTFDKIRSNTASYCTDMKVPFGEPSLTHTCEDKSNHQVIFEGLFGDADFSCGVNFLTKKVAEFADQAKEVCTAAATAVGS